MIRKTVKDDFAGNAKGWNPNGMSTGFQLIDNDISSTPGSNMIQIYLHDGVNSRCSLVSIFEAAKSFAITCEIAPVETAELHYLLTKLPANVVTSSLSASPTSTSSQSSSTSASSQYESLRSLDQIASEFP